MSVLTSRRHVPVEIADRGRLARDLTRAVRGEVRFDRGAQALYANDASIYRQVPIGVVIPRDAEDVLAALPAAWSSAYRERCDQTGQRAVCSGVAVRVQQHLG